MAIVLVTGPSRSGKSEWAEQLAAQLATELAVDIRRQVVYVATAQVKGDDDEWRDRIQKHKDRRPATWQIQEVPVELAAAIAHAKPTDCLLIDSLGTWLANLIDQDESQWAAEQKALLQALDTTPSTVIMVAEETGWGVVPAYALGRRFRDRLGSLSRAVGQLSDDVYLVTSGYAINLSTLGQPVD